MTNVSEIIQQAELKLGPFSENMVELFKNNLITVFKEEAAADIKDLFLKIYDKLADTEESQAGSAIRGKDPMSLKNMRPLFAAQLDSELTAIRLEGDQIVIELMDLSKLTIDGTSDSAPQSVDILGYYLQGRIGEWGFITPAQYKARGRKSSKPLGRLGGGFMISRDRYKAELWHKVTGVSFDEVRHPISGQRPFDDFELAPKEIDFNKYVGLALEKTMRSIEGAQV
jgi:hypothetical protein